MRGGLAPEHFPSGALAGGQAWSTRADEHPGPRCSHSQPGPPPRRRASREGGARRALKTKGNTPKYGLIFHSSFIGRAKQKNKGRISRYLANKCSIASRCARAAPPQGQGMVGRRPGHCVAGRRLRPRSEPAGTHATPSKVQKRSCRAFHGRAQAPADAAALPVRPPPRRSCQFLWLGALVQGRTSPLSRRAHAWTAAQLSACSIMASRFRV